MLAKPRGIHSRHPDYRQILRVDNTQLRRFHKLRSRALEISGGSGSFKGSAVVISRDWILTAGHNADLNDDGPPDAAWNATLHLPGIGASGIAQAITLLFFSGFANPSVNDDLALLRLAAPLPLGMGFPTLGKGVGIGDVITLVGFNTFNEGYGGRFGDTGGGVLIDP